jgi:hypothetical protein
MRSPLYNANVVAAAHGRVEAEEAGLGSIPGERLPEVSAAAMPYGVGKLPP